MIKSVRIISIVLMIVTAFCFFSTGCVIKEGEFTSNDGLYADIKPSAEATTDSDNSEDGEYPVEDPEDNSESVYEYIEPDKETAVHVTINVKHYGAIKLELYKNIAPSTVDNFVKLAKSGFYNGLTFHRIVPGFVIQGGDPKGDGTGGADENIIGEFLINGINNPLSHKRGVISMARNSYDYNSASSQFFICLQDNPDSLDGQYAGFGMVTDGMDVVDAIAMVETDSADKPVADVIIESVTIDS